MFFPIPFCECGCSLSASCEMSCDRRLRVFANIGGSSVGHTPTHTGHPHLVQAAKAFSYKNKSANVATASLIFECSSFDSSNCLVRQTFVKFSAALAAYSRFPAKQRFVPLYAVGGDLEERILIEERRWVSLVVVATLLCNENFPVAM